MTQKTEKIIRFACVAALAVAMTLLTISMLTRFAPNVYAFDLEPIELQKSRLNYGTAITEPISFVGADRFQGLDLVFLIDQSGSMSGKYWAEKSDGSQVWIETPNDPFAQRINSVLYIIGYLGIDNLHYLDYSTHRIGVVSFGNNAQIDLPLTHFKGGGESITQELMERRRNDMQSQVQPLKLGGTDFIAAFEMAKTLFEQAPPLPGPRARAIILLTDGLPDKIYIQAYFDELKELVENSFPPAPAFKSTERYHIWVVAMDDPGTDYWKTAGDYWVGIVGADHTRKLPQNKNEVPAILTEIMEKIFDSCPLKPSGTPDPQDKSPCALDEGAFAMPPYMDGVIFHIFKSSPDAVVTILRPDGTPVECDDPGVECQQNGELNQSIIVDDPMPGMWSWSKDPQSKANVNFQPLLSTIKIESSTSQPHLLEQVNLICIIQNGQEQTVLIDPTRYPPRFQARLTRPDGTVTEVGIEPRPEGAVSQEPILLTQTGLYTVQVTGFVTDDSKREFQMFEAQKTFQVGDTRPVLDSPAATSLYLPFHSIEVVYRLSGVQTGQTITIAPGVPLSLKLTIVSEAGEQQEYNLERQEDGRYMATVYLGDKGLYAMRVQGALKQTQGSDLLFFQNTENALSTDCLQARQIGPTVETAQNMPVSVSYQVETCNKQPFAPDPKYPLTIQGQVQKPEGSVISTTLVWNTADQVYQADLTAREMDQAGIYKINVVAWGQNLSGSPILAFQAQGEWNVYKTTPIQIAIVKPKPEAKFPLRTMPRIPPFPDMSKPTQIEFELAIQDNQGNPVDPAAVTERSFDALFSLEIIDSAGRPLSHTITIEKSPSSPGRLRVTTIAPEQEGIYTFRATMNEQTLRRDYVPIQGQVQAQLNFGMHDPTAAWTPWIISAEVAMVVGLLALIAWLIWSYTGAPGGTLEIVEFGKPNETLAGPFSLSRKRCPTFSSQKLKDLGIKRLRAKKDKPTEGGDRAVQFQTIPNNGLPSDWFPLEVDQPTMLPGSSKDAEIVYH